MKSTVPLRSPLGWGKPLMRLGAILLAIFVMIPHCVAAESSNVLVVNDGTRTIVEVQFGLVGAAPEVPTKVHIDPGQTASCVRPGAIGERGTASVMFDNQQKVATGFGSSGPRDLLKKQYLLVDDDSCNLAIISRPEPGIAQPSIDTQ